MLPLLKSLSDREVHTLRDSIEAMSTFFNLTDEECRHLLPSGRKYTFDDRVSWAFKYMKEAGLVAAAKRAHYQITERGTKVLESPPPRITNQFLEQFPEFLEFRARRGKAEGGEEPEVEGAKTPEEVFEEGYVRLRHQLAAELLRAMKDCSPAFFERLVVDLLVRMGYGGTREDAGRAIGGTADGGIDGIINEDRLGLDVVYIQAKRWEATIGRPEIQKFAGALQGQRARKGVFITTSFFTEDAYEFVSKIDSKITLIDGDELAQLMIDYDVGVALVASYQLKRLDSDYFAEE
jgi:restriction system protein